MLIEAGVITPQQLDAALEAQTRSGGRLGELLIASGQATAEAVCSALCRQQGIAPIDLAEAVPEAEALELLPAEVALKHRVLPLGFTDGRLHVAMADPFDGTACDVVKMFTGGAVERLFAPADAVGDAIGKHYGSNVSRMIADLNGESEAASEIDLEDESPVDLASHLQALAREPTVVNLVNLMIHEAVEARASDIHIEPFEKTLKVKYRIDGMLHEMSPPPKHLQPAITSRIKIMGGMNIAERFVPQDGHIDLPTARGPVDLRVATVPTVYGESVVLRILDRATALIGLDNLGMPEPQLSDFKKELESPHGIVLVTGPTGSGKSTTLYAALTHLFRPELKILTIEDPVEYRLDGVNQIPVNPKRGLTFADGLRAILRQDPDVIMVGEIRDAETADIAIRSALTGHLVFSTLHTNDAVGAVARLMDMGIEPFLIASSLRGVMAQRLVRRVCQHCKQPAQPSETIVRRLGHRLEEHATFYEGAGCRECRNTGFAGRMGIFEVVTVDDELRDAIAGRATTSKLIQVLGERHVPMWEDGYRKAAAGQTTLAEVLRVTQDV
ncbi:GspE/PulE family protein [Algisphaera agarilytica]|uniref:Type II secretion system protein E n=1 Tax=Algisphaera agarilytica TaxID=1385975 RepID=A0A7X0H6E0_9BACT|nr:GspE/PulE family protein [Algisphaera agarilytica]MBB6429892.1 type II secretion system protein E [Algisphaera agarilytica]